MPQAQYYPDWFDPDEHWLPQGMKKAPPMTLIEGKIFVSQKIRTDIESPDDIVGRGGVTAVRNTDASATKQLNWIYNHVFDGSGASSGATLTDAMIDKAANDIALTKDFIDELAEGQFGMPYADPHYKRFWDVVKARCETENIAYNHFHTYGTFASIQGDPWQFMTGDGSNKQPNDPIFKALLQSQAAARKKPNGDAQDFYSLFFAMGMGSNVKHYADQPDYASRYYNKAYAAEVLNLGFGATRGIPSPKLPYVDWMNIEGLGSENGDLHNGFFFERQVGNLGKVRYQEHPKVDFDWMVGCVFAIGFVRMAGYIIFDTGDQYGTDPLKIDARSGVSYQWIPAVEGTPAPIANPGYPREPKRGHDAGFLAARLYNECARTTGEPWQYCEYKIAGSSTWITPESDHTTILEHASANDGAYSPTGRRGRADAMYRIKGNAVDVWVFDPSRSKWSVENLILRPVAGLEIPVSVQGCKLKLFNETLP